MKKITLRNRKHQTQTRVNVPESIMWTSDALFWLWDEAEKEREQRGHYGLKRKRYLEHCRKLCPLGQACTCNFVLNEEC